MAISTTAAIAGGAAILGGVNNARAADKASDAQSAAAGDAIRAQQQGYQRALDLLKPYVDVGGDALEQQRAFVGLGDPDAYQRQIDLVESSPQYQESLRVAEEGLLQNASATGGLRGGNTQRALMELRPSLLASMLDQQYSRLGGLTNVGQSAAMQQAMQAQNLGNQIAGQQTMVGDARAQGILGRATAINQGLSGISKAAGLNKAASNSSGSFGQDLSQGQQFFGNLGGLGGAF